MTRTLHHCALLAAALFSALGLLVVAAAGPSAASTPEPRASFDLINEATGGCLDDHLDFGLRSYPCNGSLHQEWNQISPNGWQNVATGRCLDDSVEFGLRAFPCNGAVYQQWHGDDLALQNDATGRCVDDSFEFGLRPFGCNNTAYQRWH